MNQPPHSECPAELMAIPASEENSERLAQLLQELDDHMAHLESGALIAISGDDEARDEAIANRLRRAHALRAPLLYLGSSWLRWIARLANLPILPWGRKQVAFNREIALALEETIARNAHARQALSSLPQIEARLARLEGELRQLRNARHGGDCAAQPAGKA